MNADLITEYMFTDTQPTSQEEFVLRIDENKGIIFKIARSYANDPEAQKDLGQEIILQLWASYSKFNPSYKFSTWMYRVALNVAISHYRKDLVRQKHMSEADVELISMANPDVGENQEEIDILNDFIHALEPLNRAMMLLYLDDKSYAEIAEILDITTSNVGTRLNRIKQNLKEQFKKYNDE